MSEIANHHLILEAALFDLFANPNHPVLLQYAGSPLDDVRRDALAELEHTSSLSLLACVEAALRVDYNQRTSARGRSPLSRALRSIYQEKEEYARLDDDILGAWKEYSNIGKPIISALIGAFKYRHWLAHGRYWPPKFGQTYDYQSTYLIADTFLAAMAGVA
ncbi:MAG: hypothetical protein EOO85_25795 [Pedobacter sp.]|nr:MAG: hypothetical protein EOO85_25795 [Pedobacter sp.]